MKRLIFLSFIFGVTFLAGFPLYTKAALLPIDVSVSSTKLQQADSLLVVVKNEPFSITGRLGYVKVRFFRDTTNQDWVAITGMPVNKAPGLYKLVINAPGKAPYSRLITVTKRKFPVATLTITPELSRQGYTPKKILQTIENEENRALNAVLNIVQPAAFFTKPFIYPLSEMQIVGNYGDIRASGKYRIQHLGVDLKAASGTPVLAVNNGNVVLLRSFPDYGNTLVIDHGLGVYSLYLHLLAFNVEVGQYVKQGSVVAYSGATGYATGPHLHFSIKLRGSSVDPLKFIDASQALPW